MNKKLKKTFTILEIDEEVTYIEDMAKSGKMLVGLNEEGHIFEERDPQNVSVVIEYWIDEPESSFFYETQGLHLVYSYKGSKGYWNYFIGPYNEKLNIRRDNYPDYIEMLSKRYEIFWTIIPMTVAIFALYMYMRTQNKVFFVLLLAPLLVFFYLRGVKSKIDSKKERDENEKGGV